MNIALLGGTSQIARAITPYLLASGHKMVLFAREPAALAGTAAEVCEDFQELYNRQFELVINCIGAGTPDKLNGDYTKWFTVLEEFDNLALDYLKKICPEALYVNFSSGGVFGNGRSEAVSNESCNAIAPNDLKTPDFYAVSKLYAEAKHRAHGQLRIVDLRIYSFFSEFSSIDAGYFMTDAARAICLKQEVFETSGTEIVRDYPHPSDIAGLILRCAALPRINAAMDVVSAGWISKTRVLELLQEKYGLKICRREFADNSPNQSSNIYCSSSDRAKKLTGFVPEFDSEQTLLYELDKFIERFNSRS